MIFGKKQLAPAAIAACVLCMGATKCGAGGTAGYQGETPYRIGNEVVGPYT
jgi:hypothetical protein